MGSPPASASGPSPGYGWGQLSLDPDGAATEYKPGATMAMGAVGLDGLLIDGGAEGFSLTTTDLLMVKTTTGEVDGPPSSDASISPLRLGLEAVRPLPLASGASLLPSLEMDTRQTAVMQKPAVGRTWGPALPGTTRSGASPVRWGAAPCSPM